MKKERPESWKNLENYRKGKEQLKNAVLQHPEEDPKTSIYDFIKRETKRNLWVIPYSRFKKGDK
jgi:hypothetical protein